MLKGRDFAQRGRSLIVPGGSDIEFRIAVDKKDAIWSCMVEGRQQVSRKKPPEGVPVVTKWRLQTGISFHG